MTKIVEYGRSIIKRRGSDFVRSDNESRYQLGVVFSLRVILRIIWYRAGKQNILLAESGKLIAKTIGIMPTAETGTFNVEYCFKKTSLYRTLSGFLNFVSKVYERKVHIVTSFGVMFTTEGRE